jgi:hypothetical protein
VRSGRIFGRAILIAASLLSSADAVVLCAKKSGKVVARDACRSRETTVLPGGVAIVGPAGAQGVTGSQGPSGQLPQEVVDATGKQFGTLLQWDGFRARVTASVPNVDVPLQFTIVEGRFRIEDGQSVIFHDEPGCTGNALIADAGGLVPVAHVFGPRAYFSRAATSIRPFKSQEFSPTTPGDCGSSNPTDRETCCFDQTSMANASPAESFATSVLGVTPPFSVVPR